MGRKVNENEVKEWVALHEKGHTYDDIGKRVGRDGKTVGKHVREYLERRGQGSRPDSELDMLKREKERYQVLMELDRLREEREGLPRRLERFEADLEHLKTTLKVYEEELERLRLQVKSIPIANMKGNWECSLCGSPDYPVVSIKCSRCGGLAWYGFVCPLEKKINLED